MAEIVDPIHIRLKDGRTVRLAHFAAPAPESFEAKAAVGYLRRNLKDTSPDGGIQFGLRSVGHAADGEALVEFWSYPNLIMMCGNTTWLERERARCEQRHWYDKSFMLLEEGLRVAPDEPNAGWHRAQKELDDRREHIRNTYPRY